MVIAAYSRRQRSLILKQTGNVFYSQQKKNNNNKIFSRIFDLAPKTEREEPGKELDYSPHPAVTCELIKIYLQQAVQRHLNGLNDIT